MNEQYINLKTIHDKLSADMETLMNDWEAMRRETRSLRKEVTEAQFVDRLQREKVFRYKPLRKDYYLSTNNYAFYTFIYPFFRGLQMSIMVKLPETLKIQKKNTITTQAFGKDKQLCSTSYDSWTLIIFLSSKVSIMVFYFWN